MIPCHAMLPYEEALRAGLVPRLKELVKGVLAASALPLGTLVRVATDQPAVALTFDDGPHPDDTPPLLELLASHGARATFFLVGSSARRWPELVARLAAEGHAVGNHTWDHPSLPLLKGAYRRRQLQWCAEALGAHGSGLFRPPYGEQTLASRLDVLRCRHRPVCWDVNAEDWRDDPPEQVVARVMRRLRRGSIVLLHDTLHDAPEPRWRDRGPSRAAVAMLLDQLGDRYRFVTVPELLRLGRPVRWHWYRRPRLEWLDRVR